MFRCDECKELFAGPMWSATGYNKDNKYLIEWGFCQSCFEEMEESWDSGNGGVDISVISGTVVQRVFAIDFEMIS